MSIKQWDDMTADEKSDYLKRQLEHFIDHYNGAIARTIDRLEKVENRIEALEKTPA